MSVYEKRSFSQEGEDLVVADLLLKCGCDYRAKPGFYVDVGAHHPLRFSNTQLFHLSGWKGINFEPNLEAKSSFDEYRSSDINVNAAVGAEGGQGLLYVYNESALNGIDNDRRAELAGTGYRLLEKRTVEVVTLRETLRKYWGNSFPGVTFLNVDVEGFEMEVLQGNEWEEFRFHLILIEQRCEDLMAIIDTEIYRFLSGFDYELKALTGRTAIYVWRGFSQRKAD